MKHPFRFGAIAYPLIEIAWRGRTHPAMALAGGLAMTALKGLDTACKSRPLWQRALLGGLAITAIEYGCGRLFNRRFQIWDYRRMPLNLHGQICLAYSLAWCFLSAAALGLLRPGSGRAAQSSRARISAIRRLA